LDSDAIYVDATCGGSQHGATGDEVYADARHGSHHRVVLLPNVVLPHVDMTVRELVVM